MRLKLLVALLPLLLVAAAFAPAVFEGFTAEAAIHPIVSSACAARYSQTLAGKLEDPVGQTPVSFDPSEWDQSDLRALLATGVLTIGPSGEIIFDPNNPALHGDSGERFCKMLREP